MADRSNDEINYVLKRPVLSPIDVFRDTISEPLYGEENTLTSSGTSGCGSYPYTTFTAPVYSTEALIEDIHRMVCDTLAPHDAVSKLTELIDEASCPVDDCKRCKYFNPGSIDYCRTGEKIAEFLINTGLVKVMCRKPIDKSEET